MIIQYPINENLFVHIKNIRKILTHTAKAKITLLRVKADAFAKICSIKKLF